jgi:hypothetical protein
MSEAPTKHFARALAAKPSWQCNGPGDVQDWPSFVRWRQIYLPRAGAPAERIAETLRESQVEGGTETILVVEDNELVRSFVTKQLRRLGYKPLLALTRPKPSRLPMKAPRSTCFSPM